MNQNRKKYNWNEWNIDRRTASEIEERIGELAAGYVPEWQFDRENPDIGSVIGKIFARQMEGNVRRYNQVLDRYQTEFVNMLGISLLPAKPAQATVLMELVQDTIPGIEVYKGTKLLSEDEGGERIVFETGHNLYVTNSELGAVFMTQAEEGKILPLKGEFRRPYIIEHPAAEEEEEEEETPPAQETEEGEHSLRPFRLFASDEEGIQVNALLFYHPVALDVQNNPIYIRLEGDPHLTEQIREGHYGFRYYTEEGLIPVDQTEVLPDGETIVIHKSQENKKIDFPDGSYSLLVLETKEPVRRNSVLKRICVSSAGGEVPMESVGNGSTDLNVESFDPFGDTLSLYQECYLGHNNYFSKSGALVRLTFDMRYEEHWLAVDSRTEEESLKIIKRRPRAIWVDTPSQARAEEVSVEYFNGIGWKKLECLQEVSRMFGGGKPGKCEISFHCPDDWAEAEVGAFQGRCIRLQLLRSDNCYMRPGIHYYPHIENLRVSYTYEDRYVDAQRLVAIAGTRRMDLTAKMKAREPFAAFSEGEYASDALYLGFRRKMESGPVSILFQMKEGVRFEGIRCRFEYSTAKGFKQMKVADHTMDLSRSGIIMFMPASDMHAVTIEGNQAYWIRITRVDSEKIWRKGVLPVIEDIRPNAVQVFNVETREEEDFFLEETRPNLTVSLGADHILDVDLWVNEKNSLTRPQMLYMLEEEPDRVRVEYDILGEISSFFVKWQETDQLDDPPSVRSYVLDRMNNNLVFGDGIHAWVPRVLDDVAFKIQIRCCTGRAGNVAAGQINTAMGNLMFVDRIYNPMKAYGGSNIEDLDSALRRGANILKSRRRLVSTDDYVQEIRDFSDSIDKVRCIVDDTIHGEKRPGSLTFVVLLRDFEEGSYSFHSVSGALRRHLMESCELTIAPEDLSVVEPIFARVSVDVWAEVVQMDDSFDLQNQLRETLESYLNPVSEAGSPGWEIGVMPKKSQLLMKLNILKSKAIIKKLVVTVTYTDRMGTHEVDLDDMEENPFVVCCNGTHHVNILLSEW